MTYASLILFALILLVSPLQSDSNAHLQLEKTTITVDGSRVIEIGGKCGDGNLLAFHLPQKGWFVFSSEPFRGYDFQKVAKLDGNKITFSTSSGNTYEITSDHPISATKEKLDLWVLQITPPDDKADAERTVISCASDFPYWHKNVLLREEKN